MQTINDFIQQLNEQPQSIRFAQTMELIERYYLFTPTSFANGDLMNQAGENNGSCQLFAFAKLQVLNEQQTLACFGHYYRDEVLKHPEANDHQNIRNFIKTGWQGIKFESQALQVKSL